MEILPTTTSLYYLLIFVFLSSFTTLVLILVYSFYTWLVARKKNVIYKQLYEVDPSSEAYKQSLRILEDARSKAHSLLADFKTEKYDFEKDYVKVRDELTSTFDEKIRQIATKSEKVASDISQTFTDTLSEVATDDTATVKTALNDMTEKIKQSMTAALHTFTAQLRDDAAYARKELETQIAKDYELAKTEINNYKNESIAAIDLKLKDILPNITKDLLGKSLTISEQESLVHAYISKILSDTDFKQL